MNSLRLIAESNDQTVRRRLYTETLNAFQATDFFATKGKEGYVSEISDYQTSEDEFCKPKNLYCDKGYYKCYELNGVTLFEGDLWVSHVDLLQAIQFVRSINFSVVEQRAEALARLLNLLTRAIFNVVSRFPQTGAHIHISSAPYTTAWGQLVSALSFKERALEKMYQGGGKGPSEDIIRYFDAKMDDNIQAWRFACATFINQAANNSSVYDRLKFETHFCIRWIDCEDLPPYDVRIGTRKCKKPPGGSPGKPDPTPPDDPKKPDCHYQEPPKSFVRFAAIKKHIKNAQDKGGFPKESSTSHIVYNMQAISSWAPFDPLKPTNYSKISDHGDDDGILLKESRYKRIDKVQFPLFVFVTQGAGPSDHGQLLQTYLFDMGTGDRFIVTPGGQVNLCRRIPPDQRDDASPNPH